ncbi:MAG: DUF4411 family protein [Acidimicrobiia bacterium]|nr:DUF4411 family protein [Acidimicrobiia bacterium]
MAYLLDANVFIQAKNLHYGFDFCPAFWDWLDVAHADGRVLSVERVGTEMLGRGDDLSTWAAARPSLFLAPDGAVLPSLRTVGQWAAGSGYQPAAIPVFLDGADYFLVAHALAHTQTIVTHERPSSSPKQIKIPDACIALGVKCLTPFEMLRLEGARFVLSP